jgi:cell division protein FtsZ
VRTVMAEMGMAMMGSASASGEGRASEAALAAISSPLLEDINISGARGLLVNVTAGLDMSIGEFEEVGTTVKEFAADDATVVVGTVIDPDMRDEMRVTIVATGLGQGQKRQQPYQVVRTGTGPLDYDDLDTPTVIRNRRSGPAEPAKAQATLEYLDIPAFLRKQAD